MSVTAEPLRPETVPWAEHAVPLPRFEAHILKRLLHHRHGRVGLLITVAATSIAFLAPWLAPADPFAITGFALAPPSRLHWMGTDAIGRDVLSGVLYGARTSLLVGASVGAITFVLGIGVGLVAGYRGGVVDDVLMRATEIVQVVPRFFLVILTVALFGPGLDRIVLALGLTSWPVLARVVRAEVFALREKDFVRAARAMGAPGSRILSHELLPNVLPSACVMTGLLIGQVLLLEASLGFLGLGDPNHISWGALVGQAQPFVLVAWWLPVFPGIAISATVLGLNLLGDALSTSGR